MQSDQTRTAYLAGYFDRSACITCSPQFFPQIVVSASSSSVLETLQAVLVSAKLPSGRIKTFLEKRINTKRYQLVLDGNEDVEHVLKAVRLYMHVRARETDMLLEIIQLNREGKSNYRNDRRFDLLREMRGEKKRRGTMRRQFISEV